MNDPYKILGVSREAPQDAVKQAYRRLAMELHPDRNPDNPGIADRFKDVNAAYGIIGDARKRARFDRGEIDAWGRRRPRPQQASGASTKPHKEQPGASRKKSADADGARHESPPRQENKSDPPKGTETKADAPRKTETPKAAPQSNGKKADRPSRWLGGAIKAEDLFGPLFPAKTGRKNGEAIGEPTHRLRISFLDAVRGTTRRLTVGRGRSLDVTVPPGIRDGQIIRLRGQGNAGPLGGRGDALVAIEVIPHKVFRTEGDDVHLEVPITLEEAVLGARIRVPTVDGSVEVTVPRGTNTGATLRLRGKGLRRPGGKAAGDQLIRLVIKLPQGKDPDLEDFVRRRKGRTTFDPRESFATL